MLDERHYLKNMMKPVNAKSDGICDDIVCLMETVEGTMELSPSKITGEETFVKYVSDKFNEIDVIFGRNVNTGNFKINIIGAPQDNVIKISVVEYERLGMLVENAVISSGNELVAAKCTPDCDETFLGFYNSDSVEAAKGLTGKTGIEFYNSITVNELTSLGIIHDDSRYADVEAFADLIEFSKQKLGLSGEKKKKVVIYVKD